MDLKLEDKVAVVTGASKGIGLAIVRRLAAEGALVVAQAAQRSAARTDSGEQWHCSLSSRCSRAPARR